MAVITFFCCCRFFPVILSPTASGSSRSFKYLFPRWSVRDETDNSFDLFPPSPHIRGMDAMCIERVVYIFLCLVCAREVRDPSPRCSWAQGRMPEHICGEWRNRIFIFSVLTINRRVLTTVLNSFMKLTIFESRQHAAASFR